MTPASIRRLVPAVLLAVIAVAVAGFDADSVTAADHKPAVNVPEGYKLLYTQSFDDADSIKAFQFSDAKAWRHSAEGGKTGGALELYQQSKYKTKVRSPFNISLIAGKAFGDFVLEADLLQTGKEYGHRDMCIFFGFTEPAKFYYVHIATKADPHAHNVFVVNEEPRTAIATKTTAGIDWGKDQWHHVRLERNTKSGSIKVYYDDMTKPLMEASDKHFVEGLVGFGSFDDTGKIDNVRIWGPSMKQVNSQAMFKQ